MAEFARRPRAGCGGEPADHRGGHRDRLSRRILVPVRLDVKHEPVRIHRALMLKSLAVAAAMIAAFFAGWPSPKAALLAGAMLLLTRRVKPERVYREIDWSLLALFVGLFVVSWRRSSRRRFPAGYLLRPRRASISIAPCP